MKKSPQMSPAEKIKFGKALRVIIDVEKRGLKHGQEFWIAALLAHAVLTMCRGANSRKEAREKRDHTTRAINEMFKVLLTHWKTTYPGKKP